MIRIILWCLLLGSVVFCSPTQSRTEVWREILSFEGRDLHAMDRISQRRFINLLHGLLPEDDDKTYFRLHHYIPYYVGRYDTPGETSKVVLVEGEPLFIIPGESRVRIQIFNLKGRRLSSVAFPTGWRIDLEGARIIRDGRMTRP